MLHFRIHSLILILFLGIFYACNNQEDSEVSQSKKEHTVTHSYSFNIKEFNDKEYPDNPNIGYRSKKYSSNYFESGEVKYKNDFVSTLNFYSKKDTIELPDFNLSEFIPTIPKHIRGKDDYLCKLALVNQEWNRNQVELDKRQFNSTTNEVSRIDVSRNCLNAYLWEIIAYTKENGEDRVIAHGWFDFPKELYAKLFEKKNNTDYAKYKKPLEKWVNPKNKTFDFNLLRTVEGKIDIDFADKSDKMYPLKGARLKKYKEIITPDTFQTMRDLQSDKTTFATFSAPGYYNKKDPRHTELGRFYELKNIELNKISCQNKNDLRELKFTFSDQENERVTHLYFGGLNFKNLLKSPVEEANSGWKNSMGFGNHPFYENYEEHQSWNVSNSCYYGFLTNDKDQWLDSHHVGIDGPIMHWDDEVENRLHIWLLSFERHALVGHYVVDVK